ncbi:MAG: nitrogen fixation protein NifH [Chloroflexi bacterium]|nr:nitrogen fixation protein NifH [Chloroflexota bacterium]
MHWKDALHGDPLPWLLEPDPRQPGVRYFALRDLLGRSEEDPEVQETRATVMADGPVPPILAAQEPEGHWVKPGPGYGPKYQGTVWQVIFLAQLGADGADPRVWKGCEYVLAHSVATHGGFSVNGTPSAFIHCLAGNLGAALLDLGWLGDPRLMRALEWQARTITGERVARPEQQDVAERYYKSGTSGPLFACVANAGLSCAWGGVKAMLALGKVPPAMRTPAMQAAIEAGVEFLLGRDPAVADYPFGSGNQPSGSWFKFGYPIGYVTDVLQNLDALALLGYARDPRLAHALELVVSKQDSQGRWKLEYTYNGKTWADVEQKGQPSKWVTLRALRVLKAAWPG